MVKISIVIPYYNTYDLTQKLLKELVKQLTNETEVILIDDGCNEKRLDKYNTNINVVHLKTNLGGAGAINEGIKRAKGKYIAIVDSDDMITDNYVSTLIDAVNKFKEDVLIFDWIDMHSLKVIKRPGNFAVWKAIYKRNMIPKFKTGCLFSYDVPFQEDLAKIDYTKRYLDKAIYIYNSNRTGSLTYLKQKERRETMVKVKCILTTGFNDTDEKVYRKLGDVFIVSKARAEFLVDKKAVEILEVMQAEKKQEEPKQIETKAVEKKSTRRKKKIDIND